MNAKPTPAARILPLLALAFGLVFLVRYVIGYLAPAMVAELHMDAGELGLLSAAFALAWAFAGWLVPVVAARDGSPRHWLAATTLLLSLSCLGSAMAGGLYALIACRVLAGAAGGPAMPLIQGIVAHHLDARHRGLHMGLIQGVGGSVLAGILGPLLLIPAGQYLGWRTTMLALGAGLAACSLGLRLSLPPLQVTTSREEASAATAAASPMPATRNLGLCCAIGGLLVGWLILNTTFFPLYMAQVRNFGSGEIGTVMSSMGAGSLVGVLLLPWLSDKLGRRPILALASLMGVLAPWALLHFGHVAAPMLLLLFAGSLAGGCFPLFIAVIPSESVPARRIAASVGLVQAACEIVGGVVAPALFGGLAVSHGLSTPLLAAMVACPLAAILALAIVEPAPGRPPGQAR